MQVCFAGTPEFARAALEAIHAAGYRVPLVLTQPDRPSGRGMKLQASPVKQFAQEHAIPVLQPPGLKLDGKYPSDAQAARAALQAVQPDVLVVAAYGLILPAWVLELPRLGCLNIHASLLPRWRGAAPIHRALEAGDPLTGITIMQMDAGLDTGEMLLTATEPIHPDDTSTTLHDRLAALGAKLIVQALQQAEHGTLQPQPQPSQGVSYAHKLQKAEARLDWQQSAAVLERRIRAFAPFPGACFELDGELIKVWRAGVVPISGRPGAVLHCGPTSGAQGAQLIVGCGEQALALLELQRPGGKRISVADFLHSRQLDRQQILT